MVWSGQSSGRLVGIGECMVELSQVGPGQLSRAFAGDVFNMLWYFRGACDEWSCEFASALGDDPLSDELASFAASGGIGTTHVARLTGKRPGLYMIHLDGAERSFSYWRESSAARDMLLDPAGISAAIAAADVVYLSGITLGILDTDARGVLLELLLKTNALVAFDQNIRPALWADEVTMKDAISAASEAAQIVFPSFDDEARVFGDATPAETIARYGMDGRMVVVKDGPNPVVVARDGQITTYATPPVTGMVDTTAAGDSFNGAFLAEFLVSGDVAAAVAAAQNCAGQVICHKGALIPH